MVKMDTIPRTLDYTANLVAFKEIHYPPVSPGRIAKIYVEENDRVSKGQLLVEIFAGQHKPTAEQSKLAKKGHFVIAKADLNKAPLKVKIAKDGKVHIGLKKNGKVEEVARFSVLQD